MGERKKSTEIYVSLRSNIFHTNKFTDDIHDRNYLIMQHIRLKFLKSGIGTLGSVVIPN